MFFLSHLNKNKFGSIAFRRARAKEINGEPIKYVTKKVDDNDNVIGRGGTITVSHGELILNTDQGIVFRAQVDKTDASYLMSNDGIILEGVNLENGERESVTAHFVYYRK